MKKILLVDDDLTYLQWFLATFGSEYDVRMSIDGIEAIWELKAFNPDMVVVNALLPGHLDGLHLLDYVKDKPEFAHLPVVVMSGTNIKDITQLLTKHKANAYFEKSSAKMHFEKWLKLTFLGFGCAGCSDGLSGGAELVSIGL